MSVLGTLKPSTPQLCHSRPYVSAGPRPGQEAIPPASGIRVFSGSWLCLRDSHTVPDLGSCSNYRCPCLARESISVFSLVMPCSALTPSPIGRGKKCVVTGQLGPQNFTQNNKAAAQARRTLELSWASVLTLGGSSWLWTCCLTPRASRGSW